MFLDRTEVYTTSPSPASQGRPKGVDIKLSLAPMAQRLSEAMGVPVPLAPDCMGPQVDALVKAMKVQATRF